MKKLQIASMLLVLTFGLSGCTKEDMVGNEVSKQSKEVSDNTSVSLDIAHEESPGTTEWIPDEPVVKEE